MTIYNWFRIETTTQQGFPDLIGIAPHMDTIFVECKIAKANKITLSPHQISMCLRLSTIAPGKSFIIVFSEHAKLIHGAREILYETSKWQKILEKGVREPPIAVSWPGIIEFLKKNNGLCPKKTCKTYRGWRLGGRRSIIFYKISTKNWQKTANYNLR